MILTKTGIEKIVKQLRKKKKKIVFTNGCFDILHRGHIEYLRDARMQGDVLIVGVNSDESVKKLKGPNRPINSEDDRAMVLTALENVDHVTIFDEETPYELIKLVIPDVLVKGGDWEVSEIVGNDIVLKNGGEVKSLQFVAGKSTTDIIEKIQQMKK